MMTRVLSMIGLAALTGTAAAQSTAFTYQGRLTSAGQPAAGLHDVRFRLFDAATGGVQAGATQCADNVPVAGGLFTVAIDFGQQFVTPSARFLEIDVRADTGLTCSNVSGFVTLTPRQPISAAPLAGHARSAFALAASDGFPATAVSVDSTGNVGIGTLAPVEPLHIKFPVPVLNLQDSESSGTSGQVGLVSFRDNLGLETGWLGYGSSANAHAHFMNNRAGGNIALGAGGLERLTILPLGNVGIGTTSPLAKLDVRGDIHLGPSGEVRAASGQENLRIIRGTVAANGSILAGFGFSVAHPGEANYVITFNTPFLDTPSVTATAIRPSNDSVGASIMTDGVTNGSATLVIVKDFPIVLVPPLANVQLPGVWANLEFSFIAVGPR